MIGSSYSIFQTRFGMMGIVWTDSENSYRINRIFLPNEVNFVEKRIRKQFIHSKEKSSPHNSDFVNKIKEFLDGKNVDFDLDNIALDSCTDFQKKVLLLEYKIPRGWVSTYGRIAAQLGVPHGGRAVGNALSRNPFPIVIPCHRAIRSNGDLGGFQGGIKMKKMLLENEGITFSKSGRAFMKKLYY